MRREHAGEKGGSSQDSAILHSLLTLVRHLYLILFSFFGNSRAAVGHSAGTRPGCCFALRFTVAVDGRGTPADVVRHWH